MFREGCHAEAAKACLEKFRKSKWQEGKTFRDCRNCPEMVVVPAGGFTMGSPHDDLERRDDEDPPHWVTISKKIAVSKFEVTREEFSQFVAATGYSTGNSCLTLESNQPKKRFGRDWRNPGIDQTDRDPVVCVNWVDAQSFVTWLSGKTGKRYRLLTEAEWEYAARARTTTRYHWGDWIGRNRANCKGCGSRWDDENTAPVGAFPANDFGLHDMHGNVFEWVMECPHDSYNGAPSDGSAWTAGGDCRFRVVRGGNWSNPPTKLRSAQRGYMLYDSRTNYTGFRIARTLDH